MTLTDKEKHELKLMASEIMRLSVHGEYAVYLYLLGWFSVIRENLHVPTD